MIENSQRDERICPGLRHAGGSVLDLIASAFLPACPPAFVVLWWLFGARGSRYTRGHSTGEKEQQQQSTTTINAINKQTARCKENQAQTQRHSRTAGCFTADDPVFAA